MKPPMAYYGAKISLADQIVASFPEHAGYIEPFGGSLAVLLAKPIEPFEVVNDLSEDLMTFWRVLRDRTEDLMQACQLTPHSRAEFSTSMNRDVPDEVERARRVWMHLTQGRSATMRKTGWRFYLRAKDSGNGFAEYVERYKERLAPAAERLMNVTLECRPALDVIAEYGKDEGNLLYVDPPYLARTRASQGYEHEMGDESDHTQLLTLLADVSASVVLSGYNDPMYDAMLPAWFKQSIRSRSQSASETTEVLWSNRPPHSQQSFDLGDIA